MFWTSKLLVGYVLQIPHVLQPERVKDGSSVMNPGLQKPPWVIEGGGVRGDPLAVLAGMAPVCLGCRRQPVSSWNDSGSLVSDAWAIGSVQSWPQIMYWLDIRGPSRWKALGVLELTSTGSKDEPLLSALRHYDGWTDEALLLEAIWPTGQIQIVN